MSNDLNSDEPQEAKKPGSEILELQRREASTEFDRPGLNVALSGLSAGLDLGFSLLLMAVLSELLAGSSRPVRDLAVSLAYSLGFIFVILGRSELFTEHTTLDILPVLAGERKILDLLRLWGIIYVANLTGAAAFAWVAGKLGPALGIFSVRTLGELARHVVGHPSWVIVLSGVFAGWLMGLVSWLVAASRDTISQIALVILITGSLGLCHLHHCVAGSVEVLSAVFTGQVDFSEYLRFLACATIGNSFGGGIFVALIKYGHIALASASDEALPARRSTKFRA
jgi:formate/nitrite transporter FocA (FNT family)